MQERKLEEKEERFQRASTFHLGGITRWSVLRLVLHRGRARAGSTFLSLLIELQEQRLSSSLHSEVFLCIVQLSLAAMTIPSVTLAPRLQCSLCLYNNGSFPLLSRVISIPLFALKVWLRSHSLSMYLVYNNFIRLLQFVWIVDLFFTNLLLDPLPDSVIAQTYNHIRSTEI